MFEDREQTTERKVDLVGLAVVELVEHPLASDDVGGRCVLGRAPSLGA